MVIQDACRLSDQVWGFWMILTVTSAFLVISWAKVDCE